MKKSLSIIVLAWAMFTVLPIASAQTPYLGGTQAGGQLYEPAAFQSVRGNLASSFGLPGRVWVSSNYADQGLGYEGSFWSLGAKTRLFEDVMDGRWLFEGRGHISEEGGFFGNFGIERIFSIEAAGADVSVAGWFDYDDDQDEFLSADTFIGFGVTGQIKTRHWDLIANGYFPEGSSNNTVGDPTGANTFFQNNIIVTPGIDSALKGFDVTVRSRPKQLAFVNGSFDFGGYGYESDLVDFFGGGRARLNFQVLRGLIFSGEINYDERFDVTGVVGLTWLIGVNARGSEYAGLAKDLDETPRNEHIVRFNQEVVLAIDPDTGAPYNVVHVDNLADPGFANGSFETPFTTLAEAEASSGTDDIIFVREGDGSVRNHTSGIALQDRQMLLGDGVQHLIPIQGGLLFELSNDQDGIRPTITGMNNGNAVTLANSNTVRGFVIDGAQAPGGMANGIFGNPAVTNNNGIIEDNMISGAVLNGIGIQNLGGDWTFARNNVESNGFSGISLVDACDPTSVFTFTSNVASNNGLDGIQIINYDAQDIVFNSNVTDSNGRDGIRLENFKGDPITGVDILINDHASRFNNGSGISVIGASGDLTIMNSIIGDDIDGAAATQVLGGNIGHGINIVDFQTPGATDQILITGNDISGNGVGGDAGVNLELNEGFARALITNNIIDANGIGVRTRSDDIDPLNGIGTLLDVDVIDNNSIGGTFATTGNLSDGLRFIAVGGSSQEVLVENTGATQMGINGNGANGITFLVGDDSGGVLSNLTAVVRNVMVNGSGAAGVFGSVVDDGQISLLFEDSTVSNGGTGFNFFLDTNENLAVNTIIVRDVVAADNAGGGFSMVTGTGTFTDLALINNMFINPTLAGIPMRTDGVPSGDAFDTGFGDGIFITATGDATMGNPQVDNRTRLFIQGNTVDLFTLDGLQINSFGDASVLANIDGNTITNNGDGFAGVGQTDLPFFHGIDLTASGSSTINARVTNNLVTGNAEFGVQVVTNGASTINALFDTNNLLGNDVTDDVNTMGPENLGIDFVAINALGSNLCLSLTNNFLDANILINNSAMADFSLELDGLSNGPIFAVPFPGNITQPAFGATCEPLIAAEETAYTADGFPPNPPPILFP